VQYLTDEGKRPLYWNIPIANTTTVLLGTGISLTQAAMRELAKAGVLVGFCGGGGTPLFSANEVDVEVARLTPQNEYHPTEYLQHWVRLWFDHERCLEAAKAFQRAGLQRASTSIGCMAGYCAMRVLRSVLSRLKAPWTSRSKPSTSCRTTRTC